jgi:MFS family permease
MTTPAPSPPPLHGEHTAATRRHQATPQSTTRPTVLFLRGPFGRVMLANFAFFLNFASFFLLPLFVKELGGSEATVGWVMGTGGLATLLTLPAVALWIDRVHRRLVFQTGAVIMTLAALGYLFVHRIGPEIVCLRLAQGVAFAASFTAATTLAATLAPAAMRARALGWFGVSTLLTHALAPALGEEIIHRNGFPALFVTAALCSAASAWWISGVGEHPVSGSTRTARATLPRAHYVLAVVMVLFGMGFGCVTTYAASFIKTQQLGRVGGFFAAYTASAIGVRIFGGSVSDRWGRRVVILPALATLGLAILALAFVRQAPALIAAGALFGLAQGLAYPTLHAFLVDTSPAAALGKAQALFNGSFNLGVMASAFLFGVIADAWGQRWMFACAACTPWLAALLFGVGARNQGPAVRAS